MRTRLKKAQGARIRVKKDIFGARIHKPQPGAVESIWG
jgi:hypothetical protein